MHFLKEGNIYHNFLRFWEIILEMFFFLIKKFLGFTNQDSKWAFLKAKLDIGAAFIRDGFSVQISN